MSERLCPRCGKKVEEGFAFCPYCAAPLQEQPAPHEPTAQEILDELADLPAPDEPIYPPPEEPDPVEAKVNDWEMIDLRGNRRAPGPGPDVSDLYPDQEKLLPKKDRASWGLRILIFLVSLILAALVGFFVLLVVNPFDWGPHSLEDLSGLLGPAATPVATQDPAAAATAEPTPTPTPEPTPTPTPELPISQDELQTIITEYYRSYLECINAQDMSYLVHSSAANKLRAQTYALGEANMGTIYDTETFVVEPDWESLNVYDGDVIMLNLTFTFSGSPRQGGGTPTVTTNRVTYRVIKGSGEDGWVVDMTGFVGEEDYANHGYAFAPDAT